MFHCRDLNPRTLAPFLNGLFVLTFGRHRNAGRRVVLIVGEDVDQLGVVGQIGGREGQLPTGCADRPLPRGTLVAPQNQAPALD